MMARVFNRLFNHTISQLRMRFMPASQVSVEKIQLQFRALLKDCDDLNAQRLSYRVNGAVTAQDLWQLRSELHQCISQRHSQREAADRINSLLPSFAGWIPAPQRVKI